jgi:hypothetical protein
MSFYGAQTFRSLFSVHKDLLAANQQHRFGGAHAQLAYNLADGTEVPVTTRTYGDVVVNVIDAAADQVVSVLLVGLNVSTPATFANAALVNVTSSHTLASDTHGVLLEGSVTVGSDPLDADDELQLIEPGSTVEGNGKLVTFVFTQS